MREKWKQRAVHMNLKRAVIVFLVAGILWAVVSAVLIGALAERQFDQWGSASEDSGWYGGDDDGNIDDNGYYGDGFYYGDRAYYGDGGYYGDDGYGEFYGNDSAYDRIGDEFELSDGAAALLVGIGAVGGVLFVWYVLLCMTAVYRKAERLGVRQTLWVAAAFFFQLAAVAAIYIYAAVVGTCENCGRLRTKDGRFCIRCGKPYKKVCPGCGQSVDVEATYCSGCGAAFDADRNGQDAKTDGKADENSTEENKTEEDKEGESASAE